MKYVTLICQGHFKNTVLDHVRISSINQPSIKYEWSYNMQLTLQSPLLRL